MRVSRVFVTDNLETGKRLDLDKKLSHYLATVLRLQPGASVRVFNSDCGEFAAELANVAKNRVSLEIGERLALAREPAVRLHLALGLSRGDRMDFAVQKATELGVQQITPLYSEYGEVRLKQASRLENKMRHWQGIAVSACEQSGRIQVPHINTPIPLTQFLDQAREGLLLMLDPSGESALGSQQAQDDITLVIGPEGGFSHAEIGLAQQLGYHIAHLGPRILRTETAPLTALTVLQYRYGDLQQPPV